MDARNRRGLFGCFDELEDPRMDRTKDHRLDDLLAIAVLATVCGAKEPSDMADFGRDRLDWLKTFLALPNGVPSHDTFSGAGGCWACSTPTPSSGALAAGCGGWSRRRGSGRCTSTARRCDAASSRRARRRPCTWSACGRPRPSWPWRRSPPARGKSGGAPGAPGATRSPRSPSCWT